MKTDGYERMRLACNRLVALLNDAQPGLASWHLSLNDAVKDAVYFVAFPVSMCMPEPETLILIYHGKGEQTLGYLGCSGNFRNQQSEIVEGVTHWRVLPNSPTV